MRRKLSARFQRDPGGNSPRREIWHEMKIYCMAALNAGAADPDGIGGSIT
jgi:hypothetical protein